MSADIEPDHAQVRLTEREALANLSTVLQLCAREDHVQHDDEAPVSRFRRHHRGAPDRLAPDRLILSARATQTSDRVWTVSADSEAIRRFTYPADRP